MRRRRYGGLRHGIKGAAASNEHSVARPARMTIIAVCVAALCLHNGRRIDELEAIASCRKPWQQRARNRPAAMSAASAKPRRGRRQSTRQHGADGTRVICRFAKRNLGHRHLATKTRRAAIFDNGRRTPYQAASKYNGYADEDTVGDNGRHVMSYNARVENIIST